MKRYSILSLLILSLFLYLEESATACSCLPPPPPCEAYRETPAIFIARVTGIITETGSDGAPAEFARIAVEQALKGITQTEIKMWQGTASGDCSFRFEQGKRYLIYANYDEESRTYHTNTCMRSRALAYAAEDLDFLRGLPLSAQGTRLSGMVVTADYIEAYRENAPPQLLSGIRIAVESANGERYEATTNDEGFYKIVGLPPGSYRITPQLPSHLSLAYDMPDMIEIPIGSCGASVSFLTRTDGRIGGTLTDAQGRPAANTYIDLLPLELAGRLNDRRIGRFSRTDERGRFEFRELRPGRYLLGVNLRQAPSGSQPFPRTFFPGTQDQVRSQAITLNRGEKLTNINLRLPPRLPARVIEGTVVWPDGRPVTRALVTLKDTAERIGGESLEFANVDERGRFSLRMLEGATGWIHVSVTVPIESGLQVRYAPPVQVIANSRQQRIRLVVSRISEGGVQIITP